MRMMAIFSKYQNAPSHEQIVSFLSHKRNESFRIPGIYSFQIFKPLVSGNSKTYTFNIYSIVFSKH